MLAAGFTRAILCLLILAVPPLTEDERIMLETVEDDETVLRGDAGLDALLQNLKWEWPETIDLEPFDLREIMSDSADSRGEAGVLRGHLTAREDINLAGHELVLWMLAPEIGDPVLVLLARERAALLSDSSRHLEINIPSRFYKRYLRPRSSGDSGGIPTLVFVGTLPSAMVYPDLIGTGPGPLVLLVVIIAIGLLIWFLLRKRSFRQMSLSPISRAGPDERLNDANLPEEPADALAELRKRAEDASHE